jgi:hypothetical protein
MAGSCYALDTFEQDLAPPWQSSSNQQDAYLPPSGVQALQAILSGPGLHGAVLVGTTAGENEAA